MCPKCQQRRADNKQDPTIGTATPLHPSDSSLTSIRSTPAVPGNTDTSTPSGPNCVNYQMNLPCLCKKCLDYYRLADQSAKESISKQDRDIVSFSSDYEEMTYSPEPDVFPDSPDTPPTTPTSSPPRVQFNLGPPPLPPKRRQFRIPSSSSTDTLEDTLETID